MALITIKRRTTKTSGSIKLRFRLRDGRDLEIYHKSDIEAELSALAKFDDSGKKKPRVTDYDQELENKIKVEMERMAKAYATMQEKGMDMTSEIFEKEIAKVTFEVKQIRAEQESLINRFRRYTEEALRDNIIGQARYAHFVTFGNKLNRYLIIKGLSEISPAEVDPEFLMDFRNFIFDEYKYVPKHKTLYRDMNRANKPTARMSLNTVATQMKTLQTFFAQLDDNDEIPKSPFRKLGKERRQNVFKTMYDDPIFLRADEFQTVMTHKVPEKLEPARDAFVLQCALGCRISDFEAMTMDSVGVSDEGIPFIHYLPQKTKGIQDTNTEIQTPLVRFAFDIIKRTNFNFPCLKYVYGASGYNAQIRAILSTCKIDRKVAVYNEETKKNEYVTVSSQGSSKLCRKTHVDMMNKVQVNKYAAGLHREGSGAVDRYTNLELRDRFILMNAAFNQEPYKVDSELNIITK